MKAWLIDGFSGIQQLRISEIADPLPAPGELLLAPRFTALNPADRYLAEGLYPARPKFPHILGRDAVGTILPPVPAGSPWTPGQKAVLLRSEVGVNRPGALAGKVAVSAESLIPVPPGWTDQEAAGATLVYLTAYQSLTQWPDLPSKAVVLITGVSGGVGVASVHLAKAMGHTVIGLSRDPVKGKKVVEIGADLVLDPADKKWTARLRDFLGTRKVDLAIDSIGGTLLPEVISTLGMSGRVSLVGRLAGPVPEFNTATLFFRRIRLGGVAVGTYTNEESRAAWDTVVSLLEKIHARPLVDSIFHFDQLPAAFDRLAAGPLGKVLVEINPA